MDSRKHPTRKYDENGEPKRGRTKKHIPRPRADAEGTDNSNSRDSSLIGGQKGKKSRNQASSESTASLPSKNFSRYSKKSNHLPTENERRSKSNKSGESKDPNEGDKHTTSHGSSLIGADPGEGEKGKGEGLTGSF